PQAGTMNAKSMKTRWPGTELNRRRQPFQGCALPPELPGPLLAHSTSGDLSESRVHAMTVAGLPTANSQRWERRTAMIIATRLETLNARLTPARRGRCLG